METLTKECRDLINKYLKADTRLTKQKLCFLSQSEPKFMLIEGLKLLSLCIELDSCDVNCCEHNTENLSVETFLFKNSILSPGLPFVVPDGMKLNGNVLILLECFVRSSTLNFQQKYIEDTQKLDALKTDLEACNISLIPIVDGRTTYYNSFMDEWVCDRFKHILFKLLEYEQESSTLFEESEYSRLCESLTTSGGRFSGLDSLNSIKDLRGDYNSKLIEQCHLNINPNLSNTEIRQKIEEHFVALRHGLMTGKFKAHFVKTDRDALCDQFYNLYKGSENMSAKPVTEEGVDDLCKEFSNLSPITRFVTMERGADQFTESHEAVLFKNLRSAFNKLKSLKVLNTRRRFVLLIDAIMLSAHVHYSSTTGQHARSEWLGSSFYSINDRLVSVVSTQGDISKWIKRRIRNSKKDKGKSNAIVFHEMIEFAVSKSELALRTVGLCFESFDVDLKFLNNVSYESFINYSVEGVQPTMNYQRTDPACFPFKCAKVTLESNDEFSMLSSLCLSLVNSMKTSSTAKIRQNEVGKNRYGRVVCKEAYYQCLKTKKGTFSLLYQKTGECSKCYAINDGDHGELCSFYADPKRFFCPIFSQEVLSSMLDVMMSWIQECVELKDTLNDIKLLIKMILLSLLCHPSKRSQKLLQNMRYFIMAYISDFYHIELLDKLREDLITEQEFFLFRLLRKLISILLSASVSTMLNNRFKFFLNVSYMCHFITKETPDRLTDQIKCFEKFLEPKVSFGSYFINPKETIMPEEQQEFLDGIRIFCSKESCLDSDVLNYKKPGICKDIFSLMVSSFNQGLLLDSKEKMRGIKDPIELSGGSSALDLASNKSVVVGKYEEGERVLNYDIDKLVSVAVCQLSETFCRKGKYLLNKEDYEYKVQQVLSDLVIGKKKENKNENEEKEVGGVNLSDIEEVDQEFYMKLQESVNRVLNNYRPTVDGNIKEKFSEASQKCSVKDLSKILTLPEDRTAIKLILGELSYHLVEDFDGGLFEDSFYERFCINVANNEELKAKYFYRSTDGFCPIERMTQALTTRTYESGEFFQCFKAILLQMDANKLSGKFSHYKSQCLNFKLNHNRLIDDSRISERQSNSEALSTALSLVNCLTSALKNLCFFSQESPQSFTSVGPDTGRMKFSLSYKEQVGGNRELYIGDLRTKMFTRLIEDYFESLTNQFSGSCLNNEKEFEQAVLNMKLNVATGYVSYSLDHSKWGPMMCPFLFLMMYRNIVPRFSDGSKSFRSFDNVTALLTWHVHKMVEVPFNVVTAMMKSFIKKGVGLLSAATETITESLFYSNFAQGVIPSHVTSILDMGQGILHNTSDFYGMISERFINFAIKCITGDNTTAYTSSDDQITLFDSELTDLMNNNPEEFLFVLEFHNYLSDRLNKFISPKSVVARLVAEFKSRFFVWGDEVPLLTKFVAASLHNIKCKEPHQLAETIDTIIDQCVANGVPITLCNHMQRRVIYLLEYSNYPIDPFLLFCDSDIRDWVDGNRGYRIMRNIEQLIPEGCAQVRRMLRVLYNKLKMNELHEEFTAAYLSKERSDSVEKLCDLLGIPRPSVDDLSVCWLNLSTFLPLRMVLRQKVVYPAVLNVQEEKIPTIVKTLQNKLSSNFTRGAQKLLSEAINKSAFQSSIASGFVGLCKTLGSKCVRDPNREVHYIRTIIEVLNSDIDLKRADLNGIKLWVINRHPEGRGNWVRDLLRPLLWDYLCISLSTALEIGPWVLGDPSIKSKLPDKLRRPCDYFPLKPTQQRVLEDRVGLNHIMHSIRRLYPDVFEKHLLPFMSDLAALKLKWSPRIKFLDLCVTLDVNCEALSLISHVVKWKREEHYVVLGHELAESHERKHAPLTEQRVVSTTDVSDNFIRQVFFESFVKPFVCTTRTLGSFSWFPHKSSLPSSEGLERLGPFSSFVEKVIYKGIERPMYKYDLFSGYSWLDFHIEEPHFNLSQLIASGLSIDDKYEDFQDLLEAMSELRPGFVQLGVTVRLTVKSQSDYWSQNFSIHLQFTGSISSKGTFRPTKLEASYSGVVDSHYLSEAWRMVRNDSFFRTGGVDWFLNSDAIGEFIKSSQSCTEVCELWVVFYGDLLDLCEGDFVRVGPEWVDTPLVLKEGHLYESDRKVASLAPLLHTQDIEVFLNELYPDYLDLLIEVFPKIVNFRVQQKQYFYRVDVLSAFEKVIREEKENVLTKCFESLTEWVDFEGYTLCYSRTKASIMRHTSTGTLRLKGKLCSPLFERTPVEEID
nr:RNA-dependent RNA polymerase [Mafiga mammarenavirus]